MANNFAFSLKSTLAKFDIELPEIATKNLVNDSRTIDKGDIFAAVDGTYLQGTKFINKAIAQGAVAVIAQCNEKSQHGDIKYVSEQDNTAMVIYFYQLDELLSKVSAYYYGEPYKSMAVIGVTGTNGKTSCSQLIAQLLETFNSNAAIIGTNGAGKLSSLQKIDNTTPGPAQLQQLLAQFKSENISTVAMEVSSHALSQNRVDSDIIDVAVFTNLSRDHLDYHGDMESYGLAKQKLFSGSEEQVWVLNVDDEYGQRWDQQLNPANPRILYSISSKISEAQMIRSNSKYLSAGNIKCHSRGVTFDLKSSWGEVTVTSRLLGRFNVANLLAAIAVLLNQGYELAEIAQNCQQLTAVDGRMEAFTAPDKPTAVVDYAHTPDGLEQALLASKEHCDGELWVVFGCGGDRDKGKRPMMGKIAECFADHIVLTNDNPRSENPESITADINNGILAKQKVKVIIDRQQAVISALQQAKKDDMVLLAGKGHEDYLIIGEQTLPYYEREVVSQFYQRGLN
ncbi:UDP-N-acetylmuramoyl-L-alanyl-D-glutamate--2,6-diaminopimelate ligase [Thalassotalea crassostreae]|uniref:UDP-N-acetylmuramoyl-L-alanyl-D-glutamate--2, 6-diaminopimelate ligase n=1 Tax=Thalassotalea crassostreae TaxID=1763536 RepID=UPI000838C466|nr:UDP-N-acetylmuramoyl-L-alanyl-D-glutamate--2,6-diaminopimelate ligase [Thalassotalea crassostreae]